MRSSYLTSFVGILVIVGVIGVSLTIRPRRVQAPVHPQTLNPGVGANTNTADAVAIAKAAVSATFPDMADFETTSGFAGHSVAVTVAGPDTYLAYEVLGSGVPVAQATCFRVDAKNIATKTGTFAGGSLANSGLTDVDPRTCQYATGQSSTSTKTGPDAGYQQALADLGATDLSTAEQASIGQLVLAWDGYTPDSSVTLGSTACGSSANAAQLVAFNHGPRSTLTLHGSYLVVMTPNPKHWTTLDATVFGLDPTVICDAATFAPFWADTDHVLWRKSCSTGVLPGRQDPGATTFVQCLQAEHAVNQALGTSS